MMRMAAEKQEREVKTDGGRGDENGEQGGWRREEGASGENVVMPGQ